MKLTVTTECYIREGLGVRGSPSQEACLNTLQTSFRVGKERVQASYAFLCFFVLFNAFTPVFPLGIQAFYFGFMCGHTKHIKNFIEKEICDESIHQIATTHIAFIIFNSL